MITERDSRKDEAVVLIFIFATAGLLIWAAVKPWVGKWVEVSLDEMRILSLWLRLDWLIYVLYRVRESGGAIYRFPVRGMHECVCVSERFWTDGSLYGLCGIWAWHSDGVGMWAFRVRLQEHRCITFLLLCWHNFGLWVDYPFNVYIISSYLHAIASTSSRVIAS